METPRLRRVGEPARELDDGSDSLRPQRQAQPPLRIQSERLVVPDVHEVRPGARRDLEDRRAHRRVAGVVEGPQALVRGGELVAVHAVAQRRDQRRGVGAGERLAVAAEQSPAAFEQRRLLRRVREHQTEDVLPDHPAHAAEEAPLDDAPAVVADGVAVDDEQAVLREEKAPQVHAGQVFLSGAPVALFGVAVGRLVPTPGDRLERCAFGAPFATEYHARPGAVDGGAELAVNRRQGVQKHAIGLHVGHQAGKFFRVGVAGATVQVGGTIPGLVRDEEAHPALARAPRHGTQPVAPAGEVIVEVPLRALIDADARVHTPDQKAIVAAEVALGVVEEPVDLELSRLVVEDLAPVQEGEVLHQLTLIPVQVRARILRQVELPAHSLAKPVEARRPAAFVQNQRPSHAGRPRLEPDAVRRQRVLRVERHRVGGPFQQQRQCLAVVGDPRRRQGPVGVAEDEPPLGVAERRAGEQGDARPACLEGARQVGEVCPDRSGDPGGVETPAQRGAVKLKAQRGRALAPLNPHFGRADRRDLGHAAVVERAENRRACGQALLAPLPVERCVNRAAFTRQPAGPVRIFECNRGNGGVHSLALSLSYR